MINIEIFEAKLRKIMFYWGRGTINMIHVRRKEN